MAKISLCSRTAASDDVTLAAHRPRSLVPAQWQDTVRVLGPSECHGAALSLAHAFAADPLSMYYIPGSDAGNSSSSDSSSDVNDGASEKRWRLHVDIMTYIVAATMRKGVVTAIGPDYDGVALWLPSGHSIDSLWTSLRSGLWRLRYQLSPEGRRRYYGEVIPLLHDCKVDIMGGDGDGHDHSFYLLYLGTKPNARRQGCAQKLLEHMLLQADAEHRPVYLESSSVVNNAYYRKFGFDAYKEVTFSRGPEPVTVTIMIREPQTKM